MLSQFEDQNIEWKRSWKDEYLKTICGFANAQGGCLYIGVNDDGKVVGVVLEKDTSVQRYEKKLANEDELKQLMVAIPDKVQHALSLIVDVNRHEENGLHYIEVNVLPSAMPISYRGEYYYRSGSTTKLLTKHELARFLFSRFGMKWDAEPVPGVTVEELDRESFDIFRREAVRSRRMTQEDLDMSHTELLDKLGLVTQGQLTRAAILLFHRNPARISRGCRVRIAMFGEGSDILYQDEVQGSLFIIADRVVDLIYLKYLKAAIHYEKETRVETYPYPREAIREIIFNALIHSNWAADSDIQVRIDDNNIRISNCCILPSGWTLETLMKSHRSRALNPSIAEAFKRAGYVEVWGRGIEKIIESCKANGNPPPEYTLVGEDLTVHLLASERSRIAYPAHAASLNEALGKRILEEIQRSGIMTPEALASALQLPTDAVRQAMLALMGCGAAAASENGRPETSKEALDTKNEALEGKNGALKTTDDALSSRILLMLRSNAAVRQVDIAAQLNCSRTTVQRLMRRMEQAGRLFRQGGRRSGVWKIRD